MTRRSMRTVQQVNGEYQAAMADASDALADALDDAADRLHNACQNAYAYYQRRTSLAHRKYWQASDLARDSRDEALKWAVTVVSVGKQSGKAAANGT